MITTIQCPCCEEIIVLDAEVEINEPIYEYQGIQIPGETEVTDIDIQHVRQATPGEREQWVIAQMEIHIQEDTTIQHLEQVLRDEYHVCQDHLPGMIELVKQVYGLYTPDLEHIKKY